MEKTRVVLIGKSFGDQPYREMYKRIPVQLYLLGHESIGEERYSLIITEALQSREGLPIG